MDSVVLSYSFQYSIMVSICMVLLIASVLSSARCAFYTERFVGHKKNKLLPAVAPFQSDRKSKGKDENQRSDGESISYIYVIVNGWSPDSSKCK